MDDIRRKVGIVFPGQGSQRLGMAKDFVAQYPKSRLVFQAASDILGYDMEGLCFSDEARLNQTTFMQPAILTAEIAMFEVISAYLEETSTYFAGHSMGEYTALVAARVIPFEVGLRIVQGRNALMEHTDSEGSGGMVALILEGLDSTPYENILTKTGAEVANYNSPHQSVISGPREAITEACAMLEAEFPQMRTVRLDINLPFHSSYMRKVEPELEKYLRLFEAEMDLRRAERAASNLSGGFHTSDTLISSLAKQISNPVHWQRNVRALAGCTDEIIEVGPMRVLGRLCSDSGFPAKSIYSVRSFEKCFGGLPNISPASLPSSTGKCPV